MGTYNLYIIHKTILDKSACLAYGFKSTTAYYNIVNLKKSGKYIFSLKKTIVGELQL